MKHHCSPLSSVQLSMRAPLDPVLESLLLDGPRAAGSVPVTLVAGLPGADQVRAGLWACMHRHWLAWVYQGYERPCTAIPRFKSITGGLPWLLGMHACGSI